MLLGGGLCGSCVYFPCGKGSFIRAGVLPGLFLYSWHPTPGLEQIRTSKYDWLPGHKIRTNKSGVRLSGPTQRRPAPARLVTSAAWSGCRSGRVLSAGDCPACAAPPSGSAPPPLQCAGWLASYFVRLEILLQTKNSEWAAGAKARLAGPPSDPNTGHGGEVWGFRRQSGFSVTWAEGAAPRGLISRLCVWGVSTGSWVVFSQFGTGALVHCKSPEKGKGYSNHLFLNITAASKILIPAPSRERHFFCCSGMHPERPEQCTVGAERTPAHVHGRILHCWDRLSGFPSPPRRMLTFQGSDGLSHLAQQESPILHVFQSHQAAGRGGVLLQIINEVFQVTRGKVDHRWSERGGLPYWQWRAEEPGPLRLASP